VVVLVELSDSFLSNVSIDLCGRKVSMSKQHLHSSKISPMVEQVGGKSVTQGVGGWKRRNSGHLGIETDTLPEGLTTHPSAVSGDKEGIGRPSA
jgi:hypothetical protein